MSNVWFITGAGRGMGVDIAKAALAAGHKVVATGRNTDKVTEALGRSVNLLIAILAGVILTATATVTASHFAQPAPKKAHVEAIFCWRC